jgi:lipoate-protein ligase B
VYPIIDLIAAGLKVLDYVTALEEVMIRTAADWKVVAERNPMNRGVWVENKKLGSIGITIRRGISFHGIAFNVNVALQPFGWINPCGLKGISMTSMEHELSYRVPMHQIREAVKRHMEAVFGVKLNAAELSGISKYAACGESIESPL